MTKMEHYSYTLQKTVSQHLYLILIFQKMTNIAETRDNDNRSQLFQEMFLMKLGASQKFKQARKI